MVPYVHIFSPEIRSRGGTLHVGTSATSARRIPHNSVNSRAKNYHWGDMTAALLEAKALGFDTAALLDHAGNVTEGPGFNVFAVFTVGGRVVTPEANVLGGLTRRTVCELCASMGLEVQRRAIDLAELMQADEIFLTSSGGGVLPVVRVNERWLTTANAGPISAQLVERYWALTRDPAYRDELRSHCAGGSARESQHGDSARVAAATCSASARVHNTVSVRAAVVLAAAAAVLASFTTAAALYRRR